VVDLRHKDQPFVIAFLLSFVTLLLGGCGQESSKNTDTAEQAIDQAIAQLEIYGNSHAVTFSGFVEPKFDDAQTRKALQAIHEESDRQVRDYDLVLENLKKFADKPVEKKIDAKMAAFTKWLTSVMLSYRGQVVMDRLKIDESRTQDIKNKVLLTSLEIEHLKSRQGLIKPENFDEAIAQSQAVIADLQKVAALTDSQLVALEKVINDLEIKVNDLGKQRDDLIARIGELSARQPNVPAQEALDLQKQIADLETQRFEVLMKLESLTVGPMTLPEDQQVMIGDRKLENITGLRQLNFEKNFLETRKEKIAQAVDSQEMYLKNLQQQVDITSQKGQQLTKELDRLNTVLKNDLQQMEETASARNTLFAKAGSDMSAASRYAQQAESDLKQYIAAVNEAASQVTDGEDPFLKEAKSIESLQLSIGETRAAALLMTARLKLMQRNYLDTVVPILKRSAQFAELPETLETLAQTSQDDLETLNQERVSSIDNMISQYETLYRNAARSNLKSVVGTHYTLALYQATKLNPEGSVEYQAKAREILSQIAPAADAPDDPALKPIKELRRLLEL
jgi:hypothetical protein